MIRVLLADDHPAFLRGLQTMLTESPEIANQLLGTLAQWLVEAEDRIAALS